jgi:hypothetical protein
MVLDAKVEASEIGHKEQNYCSGLRGLEVAFPPHDPRDAGSNPAEVVEFLRTEKFGNEVLRKGL